MVVAEQLVESGLKWDQIRIVACADGTPVKARADTPVEHRTNQRVEIVVTKEPLPKDQFSEDSGKGPAEEGGKH
jgi:flagellar motor protein MotB